MLKKLKSALKNPKGLVLPLALKSGILSGLLYLSAVKSSLLAVLFLAFAFYFFFRPSLNASRFALSFLTLVGFSLLSINLISYFSFLISLFFGFLFFLLLGVKNLIFVNRHSLYYLFSSLLLLGIFISFFWAKTFPLFFIKYILAFFAISFISKEFLTFFIPDSLSPSKKNLIVYGTAFLTVQILWAIALLPLNFLNAASLALLITLILQDFVVNHFSGAMSRQLILRNITVFLILSLVIFGASKWTL